jgi:peptide-methionine (S)-S-oxide reductase
MDVTLFTVPRLGRVFPRRRRRIPKPRDSVYRRGDVHSNGAADVTERTTMTASEAAAPGGGKEIATLAGGCFWCLEAVYDEMAGVESVVSGYMGGRVADPSYEQVCGGDTGHAEVVQITFDPAVVSFRDLLEVFFVIHDSTTLNRQGNDIGTQYRSAIFYHSPEQKRVAEQVIAAIGQGGLFDRPVVTEVVPAETFWPAEDYHQEYFARNPNQSYCMFVVSPKVSKFRKKFADRRKRA